jgi:hypothetical protein
MLVVPRLIQNLELWPTRGWCARTFVRSPLLIKRDYLKTQKAWLVAMAITGPNFGGPL